ncbi:hypothetical protein [Clostridium sp. FP1]|uniref:hypothetical protein n=1 Tax=Clostridium sp. FP1 TaxID=2724076 RepID=UPI0013E98363|nr:hypothetical protein [Clostridium sp. FP1]MBZ9637238.1 hypothetical protein [Clostridium sp. FP1]
MGIGCSASLTFVDNNVSWHMKTSGGTDLSVSCAQAVDTERKIVLKSCVDKDKNDKVRMAMQNDNYTGYTGNVSGCVDFR